MGQGGTYRPYIGRRDRRTGWYLRIGRLSLTHSRFTAGTGEARYSTYAVQWDDARTDSRRWGRWLLLLPVVTIGAPVSLWAARTPPAVLAQLVVPLPPATPTIQPAAPAHKVTTHHPAAPRRAVVPLPAVAADSDPAPTMDRALRIALRLGEMQDWSADDGRTGLVVVAPMALSLDGRTCRDTTILTRNGGFEGQTQTGRFCVDSGDHITTASASVSPQE